MLLIHQSCQSPVVSRFCRESVGDRDASSFIDTWGTLRTLGHPRVTNAKCSCLTNLSPNLQILSYVQDSFFGDVYIVYTVDLYIHLRIMRVCTKHFSTKKLQVRWDTQTCHRSQHAGPTRQDGGGTPWCSVVGAAWEPGPNAYGRHRLLDVVVKMLLYTFCNTTAYTVLFLHTWRYRPYVDIDVNVIWSFARHASWTGRHQSP